jgi:hypothetical protein
MTNGFKLSTLAFIAQLGLGCGEAGNGTSNSSLGRIDPRGARSASGFEVDADGWTITGDAQADHIAPDYNGHGGNPDGLISAVDDVTGGVWYFQAPGKYTGDASATYGRDLEVDLKTNADSNPFDTFDFVLVGGGLILGFDAPNNPVTDAWTTYRIGLTETAGWRITPELSTAAYANWASLPSPTQDQFRGVLANLTRVLIRGEYEVGPDTGFLDNVRFGTTD